ncbi:MAG: hypothetical protein IPK84_05160 [Candidatus Moraniibacteriota bacterium]|nr:MAG: hypothetical protein IPK84_05160 [Candidatus Moranbacteria bacterium]
MLDIQYIREKKDVVAKAAANKGLSLDVERLLAVDAERILLLQDTEELKSIKNDLNDLMAKATPKERSEIIARGTTVLDQLIKMKNMIFRKSFRF